MKKIAAVFIICLLQCTAIMAVIQPPANAGLQNPGNICCHGRCSGKPDNNAVNVIGIFQPVNRLTN